MPNPCRRHLPCLLLVGWLPSATAMAKAEDFALDPLHTRVAFQINHAGFSNLIGTFSGSTGTLRFDKDDWATAQLTVHLPITTLDLGDIHWQANILGPAFFHAAKFPEARFVSTRVERTGEHAAQVTDELTLHGVTRPVVLTVTLNALKRHPLTFHKTAGFSATATLSRKDFGMDAWPSLIGDQVHLTIEAEATRHRPASNPDAKPDTTPAEPDDADPE
jgi:polyisoprenoid-binding protein YceI